ncbi:MAG: peptide chain release factor N(5)-glutamine methyltransferase [Clostridia bacterium]|nr:peptide chain release factor N(5)-glutamine methyltransferase [Clostridia bacterium]
MSKKFCSNIGGQAVLEGVMMRSRSTTATAVRDPKGNIQVESKRYVPYKERSVWFRIPVIRGVLAFAMSFVVGMQTLLRASEVYGDLADEQPSKFEKWLAKTLKLDIMSVVSAVGVLLGVGLALFLFVFVPNSLAELLFTKAISLDHTSTAYISARALTSGALRILIFVGYIGLTSLAKDIKRLYRYHGAEHKVVSCYENGLPLTVEHARTMSTIHDRCGTTLMFVVMVVAILFFAVVEIILAAFGVTSFGIRLASRLIGIPLVAGLSYELQQFLAKFDNFFVKALKAPGLLLQKITTQEPDDSMIEVALTAFTTVLEMDKDPSIPETKFVTAVTSDKCRAEINKIMGNSANDTETEMMLMAASNAKTKSDFEQKKRLSSEDLERAKSYAEKRKTGMPLQYAIGYACFYGYDFKVDERALIPRFDTEFLAEQVIKTVEKGNDKTILELCTGSGAVAITVKKETGCKVVASDISKDALTLAKENADALGAEVEWIESDLFANIQGTFDVIAANPPYIPSQEIEELASEVKDYEPRLALDGGTDGLDYYKKIALDYKKYLNEGGALILEVGAEQAQKVAALFEKEVTFVKDYNNPPVDRVLIIK